MRFDPEMARRVQAELKYSAGDRLREHMWTDILATYDKLPQQSPGAWYRTPPWEAVITSRTVQLAAAAVLLAALLLFARYLTGDRSTRSPEQSPTAASRQEQDPMETPRLELLLTEQLETARQLFARQDVAGLIQLLETGQEPTQVRVAEYLGQIGDKAALPSLQTLAAQWQGPAEENPFLKAIEAIQKRLDQGEPQAADDGQEPDNISAENVEVPAPKVDPEASQTGVAGVVLDKLTQKPVEGVLIQNRLSDPNAATRTDASGRFLLVELRPSSHCYVHVVARGYVSQRIAARVIKGRITDNILIELDRGSRVQGTVVDTDGAPIAGATVKTFHFTNRPVVTGPDGRFEIDGLNPVVGRYSLHVSHDDYPAISVQLSPGAVGQTIHQDVVLKPGADVYGRVTSPDGEPVEGVRVGNTTSRSMWNCITARTDADGRYRLDNVDLGEFVLWAAHPQYALYVDHTIIEPDVAERQMDIQLEDPTPLYGRVVDQADEPVAGVAVVLHSCNGVSNLTSERHPTDADGRFVIANTPAEGTIELNPFGGGISSGLQEFELGQEQYTVKVHRAGRIYGRVIAGATGEPVEEFTVKMTFSQVAGRSTGYSASWNREGYTFRSPEGWFDTGQESLPIGGNYQMTVLAQGYDPLTLDPVVVQAISDDPNRTVFRLGAATLLTGVVVDETGAAIKDTVVALFSKAERYEPRFWRQFTTDASGVFVIAGIGNEQSWVYVTAPGFTPHYGRRSDLETADGQPAKIVLSTGAHIFGTVVDEEGHPRIGIHVQAYKSHDAADGYPYPSIDKAAKTDSNGYYELAGLPAGSLAVSLQSDSGKSLARKTVTVPAGESRQVDFGNEEGLTVSGIVRRGPAPVREATIGIMLSDGNSKSAVTDAGGRFRLAGVSAGKARLMITWFEGQDAALKRRPSMENRAIQVQHDVDLDIDLGAGSVSGRIPEPFRGHDDLKITVRRWIEGPFVDWSQPERRWAHLYRATRTIEPGGAFQCSGLSAGRYYLVLSDDQRTLAVTEVITLQESEHKQDVQFRAGQGRLSIRVVDARTEQGISEAHFIVANDLDGTFIDRRLMPEKSAGGMVTDTQGNVLYRELPPGQYRVSAWARGYLPSVSEFAAIRGSERRQIIVALQPAALAAFALSEKLASLVHTDSVHIDCRVTDLDSQSLVPAWIGPYTYDEHTVALSLKGPNTDAYSLLHLPEGRYRIDYKVRPFNTANRTGELPVHEGTVTVEVETDQVKTVVLGE